MDFKNNSKMNHIKREIKVRDKNKEAMKEVMIDINEIDLEKEKTKQLELIKEIKKLELKLMTNKKYKHTKKYVDLASILNNNEEESDNENELYDTISIQSTKSITTIEYVDLLS
jgi:hypothetical protein